MVQTRSEKPQARPAQTAVGRLQAEHAAQRRGNPDRTVGVRAEAQRHQRGGHRGCRPARRAAGDAQPIVGSVENGYPSLLWILECPKNPATGKPELTWIKGVQGNDSFYVVQKAFKFTPSKEQITRWIGYLKGVMVCDSRIADRACPRTKD